MQNPDPNWHERLAEALSERGETAANVARRAGITKGAMSQWLSGTVRQPKHSHLRAVCAYLNVDMNFVLYGMTSTVREARPVYGQQTNIPVVGTAQMGDDGYWCELGFPPGHGESYIDAPTPAPDAYALQVRGDSMSPAIRDGWYVIVTPDRTCHPGEFVLVQTTDGRSMVKELLWQNGERIALMSVADGHERLTLDSSQVNRMDPVSAVVPPSTARQAL